MNVTPNERQLVHAGDQLVRENLQVFDAYPGVELKGMPTPPAKDIVGWVRTLAEPPVTRLYISNKFDRTQRSLLMYCTATFFFFYPLRRNQCISQI
jgi:hypothetical protein